MRVLILFLHGLGDQIMLSGGLKLYRERHPDHRIELMVRGSESYVLWGHDPGIQCVWMRDVPNPRYWNPIAYHLIDKPQSIYQEIIEEGGLRKFFDRIIIPEVQRLPEGLYDRVIPYGVPHKTNRIAMDLFERDSDFDPRLTSTPIPYELTVKSEAPPEVPTGEFVIIHPFSSDYTKPWGQWNWGRKALRPDEVTRIVKQFPNGIVVGNAEQQAAYPGVKMYPLHQLYWLLQRASGFVGVDSAIAHLAAAAGCPDITVITRNRLAEYYQPISNGRVTLVSVDEAMDLQDRPRAPIYGVDRPSAPVAAPAGWLGKPLTT